MARINRVPWKRIKERNFHQSASLEIGLVSTEKEIGHFHEVSKGNWPFKKTGYSLKNLSQFSEALISPFSYLRNFLFMFLQSTQFVKVV